MRSYGVSDEINDEVTDTNSDADKDGSILWTLMRCDGDSVQDSDRVGDNHR